MNDINKYLKILIGFAERKLKTYIEIDKLGLDKFETINSYLIYQTIKDNKKMNTFIYIPDKKTKSQFYIPAIFMLALYNFMDNYIDDETAFSVGDIVQKAGRRYEITNITDSKTSLRIEREKLNEIINTPEINTFILTNANLDQKHIIKKFDQYRQFFFDKLNIEDNQNINNFKIPSKFKYKSIIVVEKEIVKKLKNYEIEKNKIYKAFPFRYITNTGTEIDNIPIDPMIYIVNDYQTARRYILEKGIKIRNIIFIGANKYRDYYLYISEDLNNEKIDNCLLIGSEDIPENDIPSLHKWKWTLPELNYFNYFETYPINRIIVNNNQFTQYLNDFYNRISKIEEKYGINLKGLDKFARNLLHITIPSDESRLIRQLDHILLCFGKEGHDIVESAFYEIDEYDYEELWVEIFQSYKNLIDCRKKNNLKFEHMKQFNRISFLVVPSESVDIWEEETKQEWIRNIISFKDFKQLDCKERKIIFLGFYGFSHLKSMLYNSNKINILMYPQEEAYYKNCFNHFKKETYNELRSADRKVVSEISFRETKKIEDVSDLIKRLFDKNEEVEMNPDYSTNYSTNITYKLTFENETDSLELDENKSVLLKINQKERFERVKNLKVSDKIRIYDNSSKEELYQVALTFDTEGEFKKIEKYSKLWKNELKNYSLKFKSIDELHQHLVKNGLSIESELTLKNWIDSRSNVKFPQKNKDLLVLKKSINSDMLNKYFKDIIKSRKNYNGIMIALGRDLSDEISDYIKEEKKKGEILKQYSDSQIEQFVDQNAKKRTIKTITVVNNE